MEHHSLLAGDRHVAFNIEKKKLPPELQCSWSALECTGGCIYIGHGIRKSWHSWSDHFGDSFGVVSCQFLRSVNSDLPSGFLDLQIVHNTMKGLLLFVAVAIAVVSAGPVHKVCVGAWIEQYWILHLRDCQ